MVEGSSGSPSRIGDAIVAMSPMAIVGVLIPIVGFFLAWRTIRGDLPSAAEQVEYVAAPRSDGPACD